MIDFSTPITDLAGAPMKDDGVLVTVKTVSVNALQASFPDERDLDGMAKLKRGLLAERIYTAGAPLEIDAEEIVLLKKLVAKAYGPTIVLRAWAVIEPASVKK